ncbi:hypothetical protein BHE74_00026992 [Ensete ventricosum]|uniref:Uncharacterized protein n=1 Tax=Ensete ventricosum TaxID=4639 RepID=A0A445MGG4_ENSVE|nr:hypothetical protein BHE74_00026992 [Ensete ventricosum]RZR73345.1 hypothetical protein BHM03_00022966 [Ensete ventricosum]
MISHAGRVATSSCLLGVRFVPNQQNKLISASVDGLLCLFDTSGHIDDDDHLESVSLRLNFLKEINMDMDTSPRFLLLFQVMNVETSIAKIGFFGRMNQKFWCLTHIETLR